MPRFDDGYDPFPEDPVVGPDPALVADLEARLVQALDREQVLRQLVGKLADAMFDAPFHAYCEWRSQCDEKAYARLNAWMARRDEVYLAAEKERL